MVAAGIVLYNPEWGRLKENINSVFPQVDMLVLVDNGSDNICEVESYCTKYPEQIVLIKNNKNEGIAKALNQIIEFCSKKGAEWVLTLDQDSVCSDNFIKQMLPYTRRDNIGIICPAVCDRNDKYGKKYNSEIDYVPLCITSGSLINTEIWERIGGYDEKMFIDMVDFEYCMRLKKEGFVIVRVNSACLLHECGRLKVVKIGGRFIQVYNHSPLRCFYYARNIVYCHRKLPDVFSAMQMRKMLFEKFVKVIVFEENKKDKVSNIISGIQAGKRMKITE